MNVAIVTNLPSSYYVDYIDELSKYVNLTSVFERDYDLHKRAPSGIDWTQKKYKAFFLSKSRSNKENICSLKIIGFLKKHSFDLIIFANPCSPTGILGELFCKFNRIKYCIQSEGGFVPKKTRIRDIFKKFYMRSACAYLTGMDKENNYFKKYGATDSTLKKFNFSSLHDSDILKTPICPEEKAAIKMRLGISFDICIICVGQFIKRKGIDTLINACNGLPKNVCLLIVGGDNVPKDYIELVHKNQLDKNVIFVKRIKQSVLKDYYSASDIFILLTREDIWGLVINEAMAFGLPIITTNKSNAGLQLIENGVNGFIVESDNPILAREKLFELINDKEKREVMSDNNLKKIRSYTVEKMGLTIYNYIKELRKK